MFAIAPRTLAACKVLQHLGQWPQGLLLPSFHPNAIQDCARLRSHLELNPLGRRAPGCLTAMNPETLQGLRNSCTRMNVSKLCPPSLGKASTSNRMRIISPAAGKPPMNSPSAPIGVVHTGSPGHEGSTGSSCSGTACQSARIAQLADLPERI